ncbi:phospho-N-acetylmuramoyl-pentapeptide-transferase [Candidatus Omnitrophota bacterium]
MFYELLYPLKEHSIIFNVFRYITFRAACASVTAFLTCVIAGPYCIKWLKQFNVIATTQRKHAPELHPLHEHKCDIPTMGGLLIIFAVVVSTLLWGDLSNKNILLLLLVFVSLGLVGFVDDFLKIARGNSLGLPAITKLVGQSLIGIFLGVYLFYDVDFEKVLYLPFLKTFVIYIGPLAIIFIAFVIVGTSNALNLTDGLDGLAIGCSIFVIGSFAIVSYITGNFNFSVYLNIPFIKESGELTVFCASLAGACVGFLWFNCHPAEVFMGDTGSLALGGAIGTVAILIKQELLLIIVGGIFVWEAISVILQIVSVRFTGKRMFLMSPFHHHLQLKGWPESKVTIRLWIISFILALIGLSTLKLR